MTEAPQNQLEQKNIPVTFRVYNIGHKFIGVPVYILFTILGFTTVFGSIFAYTRLSKRKNLHLMDLLKGS